VVTGGRQQAGSTYPGADTGDGSCAQQAACGSRRRRAWPRRLATTEYDVKADNRPARVYDNGQEDKEFPAPRKRTPPTNRFINASSDPTVNLIRTLSAVRKGIVEGNKAVLHACPVMEEPEQEADVDAKWNCTWDRYHVSYGKCIIIFHLETRTSN